MRAAIPGTALGAGQLRAPGAVSSVGSHTDVVYALLEQRLYAEALHALATRPGVVAGSRAALSLTAFCCYQLCDFAGAAQAYAELVAAHADVADEAQYTLLHAQSLYKAGLYVDAQRACQRVDAAASGAGVAERLRQLQAAIAYECDDLPAIKAALPPLPPHALPVVAAAAAHPHALLLGRAGGPVAVPRAPALGGSHALLLTAHACLAYKEGRFDDSRALFEAAAAEHAPAFRVRCRRGRGVGRRRGASPSVTATRGQVGFACASSRASRPCVHAFLPPAHPPSMCARAQAALTYNVALCHYCTKAYGPALRAIAMVVDHAATDHPQLGLLAGGRRRPASGGRVADDAGGEPPPAHSVALDPALSTSAVVEALNLKAAIQYELRDEAAARCVGWVVRLRAGAARTLGLC